MRLIATFGLVFLFCFSIQADDAPIVADVKKRLLTIELESYLNAYKDASANIRELETKLTQTNSSESKATLEANRDSLLAHLDALTIRANETAVSIGKTETNSSKKSSLPDGTKVFLRNRLRATGRELDVAIEGAGFLQVVDSATNTKFYTRAGHLDIDAYGHLVLGAANSGLLLSPSIQVPPEAVNILFARSGEVWCTIPGETTLALEGQVQLSQFANPGGLLEIDDNLFSETEASGPASVTKPGQDGAGFIRQCYVEISDSDRVRELIKELVDLLTAEHQTESMRPR